MTDPLTGWRILDGMSDSVNHPSHYAHPSGVEAIDICEHLTFNLGNALKYLWRAGKKGPAAEDYRKAAWYLRREAALYRANLYSGAYVDRRAKAPAGLAAVHQQDNSVLLAMLKIISAGYFEYTQIDLLADDCDHAARVSS